MEESLNPSSQRSKASCKHEIPCRCCHCTIDIEKNEKVGIPSSKRLSLTPPKSSQPPILLPPLLQWRPRIGGCSLSFSFFYFFIQQILRPVLQENSPTTISILNAPIFLPFPLSSIGLTIPPILLSRLPSLPIHLNPMDGSLGP